MKMKKKVTAFLAFTMLISCLPNSISAESSAEPEILTMDEYNSDLANKDYIPISKIENVTVDGAGDEWVEYPSIKPYKKSGTSDTVSVDVKVAFDDERFYLYTEVKDDIHMSESGSSYWQYDSIQIMLGTHDEEAGDELGWALDPVTNTSYMATPAEFVERQSEIEHTVIRKGNITSYEASIPWNLPFEEKPEMFKFCLIANENDGSGRTVIYMTPGIHDSKYNTYFPTLIPQEEGSMAGLVGISGSDDISSGEKSEYEINILNFGEEKKQNISVEALNYNAELTLPTNSFVRVKLKYDTGTYYGELNIVPDTGEVFKEFSKKITVHPTLEIYQDKLDEMKARLDKIDVLISECEKNNIYVEYEKINAQVVRLFLGYIPENIANKDAGRIDYQIAEMEKLLKEAESNLENYILGSKIPYDIPENISDGPLEIKDGVFYGMTKNAKGEIEERPVFLLGYGHGNYIRKNINDVAAAGANYMQAEFASKYIVYEAGPIPDWRGGTAESVETEDDGNRVFHGTGIMQNVPVIPEKEYRLIFDACGEASGWVGFKDWTTDSGNSKTLHVTKEMKTYTYDFTSLASGWVGLRFNMSGDFYLDNVKIVELDGNGNEIDGENPVLNGDFEKTEADSRFSFHYGQIQNMFSEIYNNAKNGVMTCALVSLHYFPSWIYDKYPEAKKKGIRTWDPNSEVMQDLYYNLGKNFARFTKNLGGVNDICIHNEERMPLYMDQGYLPVFQSYLERIYEGDINKLNTNYGTTYKSFDEVPMPNGIERTSANYDLANCTNEYVLMSRENMMRGIKEVWPEVHVQGKLQSTTIFSRKQHRIAHAVEPVGNGRLFGVHGMDGGIGYQSGIFVDNKYVPGSALSAYFGYDYLTTDLLAPVLNTEDHIDSDGDMTVITDIGDHNARYMWEACLHGRAASAIWNWFRSTASEPGQSVHKGHVTERPDQMAKIGKTILDVNRLSKEVAAFVKADRPVQIMYSHATRNRNFLNLELQSKVYDALAYSGQRSYILTDDKYDNLDRADIMIIPACTHVPERLIDDLIAYGEAGKTIIIIGDYSLRYNEYNLPHDEAKVQKIYDMATLIEADYWMDERFTSENIGSEANVVDDSYVDITMEKLRDIFRPILEEKNLMVIDIIDEETEKTAEALMFKYTEYEGKMLLDVSYYGDYGVDKTYKVLYNGKEIPSMRELRSGRLITDSTVTLDASTPQLLQFDVR